MTKQTNLYLSSFSFSGGKLPNVRHFAEKSGMFFLKGHCHSTFAVFMSFLVETKTIFYHVIC